MDLRVYSVALLFVCACNCELDSGGLDGNTGLDANRLDSTAIDTGTDATITDGGVDSGLDSGLDSGVDDAGPVDAAAACDEPIACGGPLTRNDPWCGTNAPFMGNWSCIHNECYWECEASRTCYAPMNPECIACRASPAVDFEVSCHDTLTCNIQLFRPSIVDSNCTGDPIFTSSTSLQLFPTKARPCTETLANEGASRILGTVQGYEDGRLYADIPSLGGLCVGTFLPTGALRVHWACNGCEMTWME